MKTKIELPMPSQSASMDAAIASMKLDAKVTTEKNGGFVVYTFEDCTGREMFNLGKCYQHLLEV